MTSFFDQSLMMDTWLLKPKTYFCNIAPNFNLCIFNNKLWASLVAQLVRNLPAIEETLIRSLGWEDSLEKGMATHSSILAWRIPRTEEPGRLQSIVSQSQTELKQPSTHTRIVFLRPQQTMHPATTWGRAHSPHPIMGMSLPCSHSYL